MSTILKKNNNRYLQGMNTANQALTLAPEPVAQHNNKWTLLKLTQQARTRTLQAMVNSQGQATLHLTRNPDNTLTLRLNQERMDDHPIYTNAHQLVDPFRAWLCVKLLEHTRRNTPGSALPNMVNMLRHFDDGTIDQAIDDTIRRVIRPTPQDPLDFGATLARKATLKNLPSTVNRLIRNSMTSQQVLQLVAKYLQPTPSDTTPRQYNTVALNLEIFRTLDATSPNILHHYCEHIAPYQEPRIYQHPRDLVQQVRQNTNFSTPAQWRYFCRLWSKSVSNTAHQMRVTLQEAMELLEKINRPNAPDDLLGNTAIRRRSHEAYSHINWEQGDPQQALVHLLNQFAAPRDTLPSHRELDHVQDAMEHHFRTNQPWGPGNWENLLARTARWHQNRNIQNGQPNNKQADTATWHSLIQETTHNQTFIKALTSSRELQHTGNIMRNCIGTYWDKCLQGTSRIFTMHQAKGPSQPQGYPQQIMAAVELTVRNGSWQIGQMEAPMRGPMPDQALKAARHLRDIYQEAQDHQSQRDTEHHSEQQRHPPQRNAA